MASPIIQSSFSAGELSPHMFGRVDLNKYKIGAARMFNFLVDYRGGAGKRPGTKFVGKCKYNYSLPVILVPFQFNADQSYVLELGEGYMRVISNGGYVLDANGAIYEMGTGWHAADLPKLKWTQSADVMTFVHGSYPTYEITRYGHADWRLAGFSIGATIGAPTSISVSFASDGYIDPASAVYVNYGYAITSIGEDGAESLASFPVRTDGILDMSAHRVTARLNWGPVDGAQYYNVYKATVGVEAQITSGTRMGFLGSTRAPSFNDSNILPNFTKTAPLSLNPFAPGKIEKIIMQYGGSDYPHGSYGVFSDPGGYGATAYGQIVYGYIQGADLVTAGYNFTQYPSTVTFPYWGSGDAWGYVYPGPMGGTYPSAVAYFQQRLLFAASNNRPATLWGSKPGAFHNFDYSIPLDDGDSFEFTLASQQLNAIKYMIPMPGGLVILTSGGAWQLSGTQQFAPVTPTAVMATPQAFNGCGDLQPITIGFEILFVQTAGSVVRNLSYNFFANIYTGADVTVLSAHLFNGHYLKSWSYAEEPDKVIWAVRNDGKLLSFTFLKDQEVAGWAQHGTAGEFVSTATIREGLRDVTYFAVTRYHQTEGWVNYIEQMGPRQMPGGIYDAWFLDCALSTPMYYGTATLFSGNVQKTNMIFYADGAIFHAGWVGIRLHCGGGKYDVIAFHSSTVIECNEVVEAKEVTLFEETGQRYMTPQKAYAWGYTGWYLNLTGLSHLEGQTVSVFADGQMQSDKVVRGGAISLDSYASQVVVGLGYNAELQTLRLESQPTIQGRMKKIPAMHIRVADTRGLTAGMTWETLVDVKDRPPDLAPGKPIPLLNEDLRIVLDPLWNEDGQICIRSTSGYPANIIAVIPEAVIGDT